MFGECPTRGLRRCFRCQCLPWRFRFGRGRNTSLVDGAVLDDALNDQGELAEVMLPRVGPDVGEASASSSSDRLVRDGSGSASRGASGFVAPAAVATQRPMEAMAAAPYPSGLAATRVARRPLRGASASGANVQSGNSRRQDRQPRQHGNANARDRGASADDMNGSSAGMERAEWEGEEAADGENPGASHARELDAGHFEEEDGGGPHLDFVELPGRPEAYSSVEAAIIMSLLPHERWNVHYIRDEDNGEGDAECKVCLTDYEPDEEIVRLPCMHYAHTRCIEDWLVRNPRCPLCRTNVREYLDLGMS